MSREKYYTEDIPVKDRTCAISQECPRNEKDKAFAVQCFKDFLLADAYPRRPLPDTCNLSVGRENGKYCFLIESICSNAMILNDGFRRGWWFDSITDTLQSISELLDDIPEAIEILEK